MNAPQHPWWRPDALPWRAHAWSVELRHDELAEIRFAGRPLLRSIRAVVRDRGWLTVPAVVTGRELGETRLRLQLRHAELGAEITSTLTVEATPTMLRVTWSARNRVPFDTCRTGLVALHPANAAGTALTVEHSDGRTEASAFPTEILPWQPATDIRALRIDAEGLPAEIRFAGDVFEMEDQRNWSDASFKTYSRPLALPFPYPLAANETVEQSIEIRVEGVAPAPAERRADTITLTEHGALPDIGLEASTAPDPVPVVTLGRFRVVELDLRTANWPAALDRAARDGLPLDVRLVVGDAVAPLDAVAQALAGHRVLRVTPAETVLHITDVALATQTRSALDAAGVRAPLGAGTRAHFTELNRERERMPDDVEDITVVTTPLFHSTDTEQLVESLAMQRLIAVQTVAHADGRRVHLGPVSLRPRFNSAATVPQLLPPGPDLSAGYGAAFTGADDPRQSAEELAAWTIASAAALLVPGVTSASWFETAGPRGIIARDGTATAARDALAALAELHDRTLLSGPSLDGTLWAIGGRGSVDDVVLVANVGRSARTLSLRLDGMETIISVAAGHWQRITLPRR